MDRVDTQTEIIKVMPTEFLGHVMRRQVFKNLCLTSKIKGTRERGREKTYYLDSVCRRMKAQLSPLKYTQDQAVCGH